ncbi:hypothetical protein [Poriferisphaera sp. WC338]|uniref:hypothetical protein n=1 Tax=Poriferisphaera sp. WC338 TaxID=3425129 RepID=UPI003D817AE4
MEDKRTQKALDELADLFLTGISSEVNDTSQEQGEAGQGMGPAADAAQGGESGADMKDEKAQQPTDVNGGVSSVPQPRVGGMQLVESTDGKRGGLVKLRAKTGAGVSADSAGSGKPLGRAAELVAGSAQATQSAPPLKMSVNTDGHVSDQADEEVTSIHSEGSEAQTVLPNMVKLSPKVMKAISHKTNAETETELEQELKRVEKEIGAVVQEQDMLLRDEVEGLIGETDHEEMFVVNQPPADHVDDGVYRVSGEIQDDQNENREEVIATQLREHEEDDMVEVKVNRAAFVEAVYLGNLPGVSGPWLTQYAQLVAQEEGPVAVLHVDDEQIDLELVEPIDPNRRGPAERVDRRMRPRGSDDAKLTDVLDELLSGESRVRTILVHLDAIVDTEAHVRSRVFDDVTVCCGCDDMAVMSVISLLRASAEDFEDAYGKKNVGLMIMGADESASRSAAAKISAQVTGELGCDVQLAGWQQQMVPVHVTQLGSYVGTGEIWPDLVGMLGGLELPGEIEAAQAAAAVVAVGDQPEYDHHYAEAGPIERELMAKHSETSDAVAEVPETQSSSTEAILTAESESIEELQETSRARIREETVHDEAAGHALEQRVQTQAAKEVAALSAARQEVEDARRQAMVSKREIDELRALLAEETARVQEQIESRIAGARMDTPVHESQPDSKKKVEATVAAGTSTHESQSRDSASYLREIEAPVETLMLSEMVTKIGGSLEGGILLEAYCPKHPEIEIVVDESGGLHLLGQHDSEDVVRVADGTKQQLLDEAALQAVVMQLLEARQWAEDHTDLLQMTQRQMRIDMDRPVAMHLFTDRAELGTELIGRFEGGLYIHLMQVVEVKGEQAVFCTPLG